MKLKLKKGSTGRIIRLFIQDASVTDGGGLAGLTHLSAGLTAAYIVEGQTAPTTGALTDMTVGTWVEWGFKEISSALMPGVYELGLPDGAIATGKSVLLMLHGAESMVPCLIEIELDAIDYQTAIPDAVWTDNVITAGRIAADAVTELKSGLATAGDVSGARDTIVAEVNANETKIDALSTQIGLVFGTGSQLKSYRVTNAKTGAPIAGVVVWITPDATGSQLVAGPQYSNSQGYTYWLLSPGTYYFWRQAPGYRATNPDQETVS